MRRALLVTLDQGVKDPKDRAQGGAVREHTLQWSNCDRTVVKEWSKSGQFERAGDDLPAEGAADLVEEQHIPDGQSEAQIVHTPAQRTIQLASSDCPPRYREGRDIKGARQRYIEGARQRGETSRGRDRGARHQGAR